jgi:hypothetical protein
MAEEKPIKFLSRQQLRELGISYSNRHMLKLEDQGKLPRRVYLSVAQSSLDRGRDSRIYRALRQSPRLISSFGKVRRCGKHFA